ncbi:MAG: DUF4923 family protein [Muribaculaceae bacterium]|nr:DUF4923 family protein [Muribaculaceae bacterium]
MKIKRYCSCLCAIVITSFCASAQLDLGNLLNSGLQTIQNATASTKFDVKDLVGTWIYTSPAVSMKGDNALANIGGAAAATTIENKLSPYYQKLGLQNTKLTVNNDLTFTMNAGAAKLSGTIEKSGDNLVFNFSAFGKITIGKVDCLATKSGSTLNLTFDSSKLLSIIKKVSSLASNTSISSISSLLSNYDGLYLGAKMKKTS